MNRVKSILYIEGCNYNDFPMGGTLSFAKQFIENIYAQFYLVGLGSDDEPEGKWFIKNINGIDYNYFSIGKTSRLNTSRLPKRLITYLMLKKHLNYIHANYTKYDIVFSQTPQFVFLISRYKWNKSVFCFAGLGNSVGKSRYKFLRFMGGIYEYQLFKHLRNIDVILAAADSEAISEKEKKYNMSNSSIIHFPTRFNPEIFYHHSILESRKKLKLSNDKKIIISVGRLSYIKGWEDMIKSFRELIKINSNAQLLIIGDGEDKQAILEYAKKEIDDESIVLLGRKSPAQISDFLNASDLFIMFSLVEGWPTAMVEALACGKPIVTSLVSGAKEMVIEGENGYIVRDRSISDFAIKISSALELPNPNKKSLEIAKKYSSSNLNSDFYKILDLC